MVVSDLTARNDSISETCAQSLALAKSVRQEIKILEDKVQEKREWIDHIVRSLFLEERIFAGTTWKFIGCTSVDPYFSANFPGCGDIKEILSLTSNVWFQIEHGVDIRTSSRYGLKIAMDLLICKQVIERYDIVVDFNEGSYPEGLVTFKAQMER